MKQVRISRIELSGLGPIRRFSAVLGDLNLIYGRNEQGKTWIVEFLIRSLFSGRRWGLRDLAGNGRITVSGLQEKPVEFSLTSPKIETFLEETEDLPADFSRLLVVKAGELSMSDENTGPRKIDKQTLKQFLSNQNLLDRIENRISANLRRSQIEDGKIAGPKQGEIKRREEYLERLQKIDRLFDQISKGYSGSQRKLLSIAIEQLNRERENLLMAKRHKAWKLAAALQALENQITEFDIDSFNRLAEEIRIFQINRDQHAKLIRDSEQAAGQARHYLWLKNAHELVAARFGQMPSKPPMLLAVLAGIFVLAAGVFVFLDRTFPAAGGMLAAVVCGIMYMIGLHRMLARKTDREEYALLKNDFKNRFDEPFSGPAQLETLLEERREAYAQAQVLKQQANDKKSELERCREEIGRKWMEIMQRPVSEEHWFEQLNQKQNQWTRLQHKRQQFREDLIALQTDPADYLEKDPGTEFDQSRIQEIIHEIESVSAEHQEINQKLDVLKQKICQETGDSLDQPWDTILLHLQETRNRVLIDYQDITAEIIGKLMVRKVIGQMRIAEDEKIVRGLASPKLSEPLLRLTGRYNKLRLFEQEILVMDDTHEFPLSLLSTGTQEQVLLALRLGFASRLFDQDRLFFILDDAFQHSDWQRREYLVDQFTSLAADGWQILYFTMDDHIRDLFHQKGKKLGSRYVYHELNQIMD